MTWPLPPVTGESVHAVISSRVIPAIEQLRALSAGASEPDAPVPYMLWMNTSTGDVSQRNSANTAWNLWFNVLTGGGIVGAAVPAASVVAETSFGLSPAVGASLLYARADHTHGSPATPIVGGGGGGIVDIERMTTAERDAIVSPSPPRLIFNTTEMEWNIFTTVWETITSAPWVGSATVAAAPGTLMFSDTLAKLVGYTTVWEVIASSPYAGTTPGTPVVGTTLFDHAAMKLAVYPATGWEVITSSP